MKYAYFFLFVWSGFFCTIKAKAQSSVLLEPTKDNGIFSKRDSVLDISKPSMSPVILPATGEGTRLMWIPSKSAFRVGTIMGSAENWNANNIGAYSIAGGFNVIASGITSVALGHGATAKGNYSLAGGGYGNYSSGESSIALGEGITSFKFGGVSMGAYNDLGDTTTTNFNNFTLTDRIFQLGNGYYEHFTNDILFSNAITVLRNGNMGIGNIAATLAPAERLVIDGNVNIIGAAKGIMLSGNSSPLLTKTSDVFTSGSYQNLGRWGLFKDTDNLTFGIPAITNKTFRFVSYNVNSTINKTILAINQNGNVSVDGFSKLGSSAPAVKILKLTGTTAAAQGTYTSVAHGLNLSKILSVDVFVSPSATEKHGRGWTAYSGFQFDFYVDSSVVQILNIAGNSNSILSKPYTVLITYEE